MKKNKKSVFRVGSTFIVTVSLLLLSILVNAGELTLIDKVHLLEGQETLNFIHGKPWKFGERHYTSEKLIDDKKDHIRLLRLYIGDRESKCPFHLTWQDTDFSQSEITTVLNLSTTHLLEICFNFDKVNGYVFNGEIARDPREIEGKIEARDQAIATNHLFDKKISFTIHMPSNQFKQLYAEEGLKVIGQSPFWLKLNYRFDGVEITRTYFISGSE